MDDIPCVFYTRLILLPNLKPLYICIQYVCFLSFFNDFLSEGTAQEVAAQML